MKQIRSLKRLRRVTHAEVQQIARHFERRSKAQMLAAEIVDNQKKQRLEKGKEGWKSVTAVMSHLKLSDALYESGRFTAEQYFFHCASPVESLHEHRLFSGVYDEKIKPISSKIRAVEIKNGLPPDHYWPVGGGPAEYRRLNERYNKTVDSYLAPLFRELGLAHHARLWLNDRAEYSRLREAGRASTFDAADIENATLKLIEMYEFEAKKCAKSNAYYAAVVMLGSASEALILLRCLQKPAELSEAIAKIPKSIGLHKGGPRHWSLGQLIQVARIAGWVANLETENVIVQMVNLVGHLQELRNLVHPGRHVEGMPHTSIGHEQYLDARSAHLALRYSMEKRPGKSKRKAVHNA